MKKLIMLLFFTSHILIGQITFKVSDDVYYSDISIKIGSDVYYPDFSVGISSNRYQADFIITENSYADFNVKAGSNVYYPDLSIKAGKNVYYPDISVKLVNSGTVDYVIYNEKDFINMADIISALLPVIHKHTDYQHDALNELFK